MQIVSRGSNPCIPIKHDYLGADGLFNPAEMYSIELFIFEILDKRQLLLRSDFR